MRASEQTRFLLRGSTLLFGLLTLWWFVLVGPMLYMLEAGAGVFMPIEESPSGDWTVRVPFDASLPATPQQPVARQLRSIDFDISRSDVITFTFSLPVYWAIILAAPNIKRNLRPLLLGTAVMAAGELALLLSFAYITASDGVSQMTGAEDATGRWIRHVGVYLVASVLPYAGPFVVALSLHRELREQVFAIGAVAGPRSAKRERY
jgi:hypothetical protein